MRPRLRFTSTDGPALIFLGMFVLSISLTAAFVGLDMLARIMAIVGLVLSGFGLWPELSYHDKQGLGQSTGYSTA